MAEKPFDPAMRGDLPVEFADSVRMKVPPPFESPGVTLSPVEKRSRKWKHRREFLKQEISGHAVAFFLFVFVLAFFTARHFLPMLLQHLPHH